MSARSDRDDYLSLVIHELRNPLVGIDAAARVLSRELGAHPASRRASAIASEARHLLALLESVADAEAAAAGRLRCFPSPIDLAALVHDTVAAMHITGHPVAVRGADAPVVVHADAARIRQVLANLLANAAQYSPASSPIDVTVSADDRRVSVTVRDRGPGIAAAERRRLFRKFTRLSTADGTRGSGLGLYICKAIVEDHGGTITYRANRGSAFSFDLPVRTGTTRKRTGATEKRGARAPAISTRVRDRSRATRSARAGDVAAGAGDPASGRGPATEVGDSERGGAGWGPRARTPSPPAGASPARALRRSVPRRGATRR